MHMPEVMAVVEGKFTPVEKIRSRTILLWSWLLGAGLIVLVVDLTVRRTGGVGN